MKNIYFMHFRNLSCVDLYNRLLCLYYLKFFLMINYLIKINPVYKSHNQEIDTSKNNLKDERLN